MSSRAARRLVDAYFSESIAASKAALRTRAGLRRGIRLPRLREVASARQLYATEAPVRLAVAVECARRLAWERSHPYFVLRHSTKGPLSRLLIALRQRLLPPYGLKSTVDRMLWDHERRYARLMRLVLYRPPLASDPELEALLACVPKEIVGFPVRSVYRAVVHYLRGAPAAARAARTIRRHGVLLGVPGAETGDPAAIAEAILRLR